MNTKTKTNCWFENNNKIIPKLKEVISKILVDYILSKFVKNEIFLTNFKCFLILKYASCDNYYY